MEGDWSGGLGWSYQPPAFDWNGALGGLLGKDMKGPLAQFAANMAQQSMGPKGGAPMMMAPPPPPMPPRQPVQPMLMPQLFQAHPMGRLYG